MIQKKGIRETMADINMIRIEAKMEEMFMGKIDMKDFEKRSAEELKKAFLSRSLAALAIMMEVGIDDEVAAKCVTDGYHDMGIDGIFCDERKKRLVLVQSKWRGEGTGSISQDESLELVEGIKRIMGLEFDGGNNKIQHKIPEITQAIKDMDYTVLAIFCHTGSQNISDYAYRPINSLIMTTNDESSEILKFTEIKTTNIFSYLSSGQGNDIICLDDVILNNWGLVEEPLKAYYGTISAAAIGDWFSKYGNKLFAKNIRFYKGNTEVNEGIKKVLRDEPENFFYYNNGIKMLCEKITRKSAYSTNNKTGLFLLEGVSLVNGAQTTGTIGEFYCEDREKTDRASVYIQIIDLGETKEETAVQITKLSNTQNKIDNKDFAALDSEQERLRSELMFSDVLYLYKTGASVEDFDKQISIDEAIVSQACMQPEVSYTVTAKKNVGALTEDIGKAPYKVLFNSSTNAFTLRNGILVMRCVDKFLQVHENDFYGRNRLALIHGNRLILHIILQELKSLKEFDVKMLDKELVRGKVDKLCDKTIDNLIRAMNKLYPEAYPAYIFKNVGKCRDILNNLTEK